MPVNYHFGKFPPRELDLGKLFPLVGPANAAVARYEGVLAGIPNPNVLLSPLTAREAVLSSKIEGTQVTLGEVLEFEAQGDLLDESTPKKADAREVLNYRAALNEATRMMADGLPLSQRLIKSAHAVLMDGVRGRGKAPGEYRRIPNWIGPDGCIVEQARFVPPAADRIDDAMAAWETYIHADAPDRLVQLAIVHAEFESIHPFLDGNGRLGRLIIPLFLYAHGLLTRPNFYLSEYLEANREEYYDRMLSVSRDGDWTGWVSFFLQGIIAQAEVNTRKAQAILTLHQEKRDWVVEVTRSQYAVRALDWIFQRPIFRTPDFVKAAQIPGPTARGIVRSLRDNGMLQEIVAASGRTPAVFMFRELLNIAEGRAAF
ncbi:MAG TPA: Fic/DOC family N-terminal domain-containing protein [Sphingopyxis sp.]|nr:Fic/DOC family N-terminal domain-containing protein [Sphingopyxis sp.]HMP44680.1 Fic/DOC family N-terminal domain-containing protein [Sphingopyxis sp.]HMQ18137.1 Fic/DOC family N-terminal domain-containing protein [Sphingopyxis sp.]